MIKMLEDILGSNYLRTILVERGSSGSLILALTVRCQCLHIFKKSKENDKRQSPVFKIR